MQLYAEKAIYQSQNSPYKSTCSRMGTWWRTKYGCIEIQRCPNNIRHPFKVLVTRYIEEIGEDDKFGKNK